MPKYTYLLVVWTAWISIPFISASTGASPKCVDLALGHCKCVEDSGLLLSCPFNEPDIVIYLASDFNVWIECHSANDAFNDILPSNQEKVMQAVTKVAFRNCPMPAGSSLSRILQGLGVHQVTSLELSTVNDRCNFSIQRQHLSSFRNLRELTIDGYLTPENQDDIFDDVGNITSLKFRNSNKFTERMLENLTEMISLCVENITTRANSIHFRMQKKIEFLRLWETQVNNISFSGIAAANLPSLGENELESEADDFHKDSGTIQAIELKGNRFSDFPKGLFAHSKKLRKFRLTENRVKMAKLPERFLADLPVMSDVRIQCGLSELTDNVFEHSSDIKFINLSDNDVQNLPPNLLATQFNLTHLDLSGNRIAALPDSFFDNTHNLNVLILSDNELENVSAQSVGHLKDLEELYLNDNNLHYIDFNLYTFFQLRRIDLSHNQLSVFPTCLDYFYNSVEVDLRYNNMTVVNMTDRIDTHWYANGVTFDLSHNNISGISFNVSPKSRT